METSFEPSPTKISLLPQGELFFFSFVFLSDTQIPSRSPCSESKSLKNGSKLDRFDNERRPSFTRAFPFLFLE